MRLSLVGQASSAGANLNNTVHVASVLKYCSFLGMSIAMDVQGDPVAAQWVSGYGVPLISDPSDVTNCEVLLRGFGSPGAFPARPLLPRVVDMVFDAADSPGDADHVLSFYTGTAGGKTSRGVLSPLPREISDVVRAVVSKHAVVFLGQDPGARTAGIVAAIDGGGFTASGFTIPATLDFWNAVVTADVLVASGGIPALVGGALGIPTLMVTNNAAEDARVQSLIPLGQQSWEYIGTLPSLTNAQVRTEARDLMGAGAVDKARRYAMSAHGLLRLQEQGVRRISEWVYRFLVGSSALVVPLQTSPQWPHLDAVPQASR